MSLNEQTYELPAALRASVEAVLDDWRDGGKVARLWAKDAALWTDADEARWLGWLSIVERQLGDRRKFAEFRDEIERAGFSHLALLGMGGSSLAPEVLGFALGAEPGFPALSILDSTDPAQIVALERKIDAGDTLFVVSSKSGSTLEPNIFQAYFYERVARLVGEENAGTRFVAVTDPGSKMHEIAESKGFRRVFFGDPEIGGRYSALSDFGMIPLAASGADVAGFLEKTEEMTRACRRPDPRENPGVVLGAILGAAWRDFGRDKVTIFASPGISGLGAWLEQLLAESTGKNGKSLIPIDGELVQSPALYGADRVFVHLKVAGEDGADAAVEALAASGQPVVRIVLESAAHLGQEFFRWEIATAVAGSVMNLNPFDQPDVEASKIATKRLTAEFEATGSLPAEEPFLSDRGIRLFADAPNRAELEEILGGHEGTLESCLAAHLSRIGENDYFGVLAYLAMTDENRELLQSIRRRVSGAERAATCLGFGPRFLHSTGQAYKGGANNGVFLQITCDDAADVPVPGQKYTFGVVKAAQARGDFAVLAERGRRALRIHLPGGAGVREGLARILAAVEDYDR